MCAMLVTLSESAALNGRRERSKSTVPRGLESTIQACAPESAAPAPRDSARTTQETLRRAPVGASRCGGRAPENSGASGGVNWSWREAVRPKTLARFVTSIGCRLWPGMVVMVPSLGFRRCLVKRTSACSTVETPL